MRIPGAGNSMRWSSKKSTGASLRLAPVATLLFELCSFLTLHLTSGRLSNGLDPMTSYSNGCFRAAWPVKSAFTILSMERDVPLHQLRYAGTGTSAPSMFLSHPTMAVLRICVHRIALMRMWLFFPSFEALNTSWFHPFLVFRIL